MAQLEKIYHSLIYIIISQPLDIREASTEELDIPSSIEIIEKASHQKVTVAAYLEAHYINHLRPQSASNLCLLQYIVSAIHDLEPYLSSKHLLSAFETQDLMTILTKLLDTFEKLFQLSEDEVLSVDQSNNLSGLKKRPLDQQATVELNPMGMLIFTSMESVTEHRKQQQGSGSTQEYLETIIREFQVEKIVIPGKELTVESLLKQVIEQQKKIQQLEAQLVASQRDEAVLTPRRYRFNSEVLREQRQSSFKPPSVGIPVNKEDDDDNNDDETHRRGHHQCSIC